MVVLGVLEVFQDLWWVEVFLLEEELKIFCTSPFKEASPGPRAYISDRRSLAGELTAVGGSGGIGNPMLGGSGLSLNPRGTS